ncbi:MAG: DEAD/DEAH box helicase family protein [Prevotella sp.]|nr:DEAD/DEAH box helicase family protein [Prevotella sp.]
MNDDHIARLESEIRYLKGLLDENGIPYDYEAFVEAAMREKSVEIEFPTLTAEHAIQFYSYFRGRKDVYVKRNAKKTYYTQCNNFWKAGICPKERGEKVKCQECPVKDYKELKIPIILEHLKGTKEDCSDVIGLYPLFPDGTCWFLVFDFDNHDEDATSTKDWEQEVDALRKICFSLGIDALVERSRSGQGAHVWIFFSEAIQAAKVRRFGEALLAKGAESVSLKSFRYYDRMMPMQDSLPEGKLGNLIAIPLQGQALRKGNSAFVNEYWKPYKDQWSKLLHTRKMSEAEVDAYVKSWCPEDNAMEMFQSDKVDEQEDSNLLLFGSNPKSSTRYFKTEDATGAVKIIQADGIYIDKRNLKPRLQNAIRRLAAYSNPQFFQNLALGFSTRETPRIVYDGYDEGNYIVLPRGCFEELKRYLSDAEISYDIVDKRQEGRTIDVSFNGELYPEQMVAAERLLAYDIGMLAAATAFGKTVIGANLIARRKVNTLVLVHTVEIMNNWVRDLNRFLTINEQLPTYTTPMGRVKQRDSVIGTFSSQKKAATGIIDIAMIGSLGKEDDINSMVRDYGMIIVDECHHAAATTFENVLRASAAKYVYGMSATVKRGDKQERKLLMQLGPIRHRYTAKERAMKQGIGHYIYPRFTRMVDLSPSEDKHISELYRLIVDSELRNMQIVADTVDCVKKGRTPVVMTKYREHAENLYGLLQGAADHVFLLQGGKSLKARAELREKMAAVSRDESMIMVAIGQYIGEGFNYPRLDTMLLAMPISFEGNIEQYAGRLNRDYEGKKDVIIFDYIDQHIPVLERMYHRRLRTYKKIGFEVCAEVMDKQEVSNSIFDSTGYWEVFEKDILSAAKSIVVSSPFLSSRKVEWLVDQSDILQKRGVTITVFSLGPEVYPEDGREHHGELLERLTSAGICVKTQNHYHERYAVIDQSLVWYGSMNLLSRGREDDSLMRIVSPEIAAELLELGMKSEKLTLKTE